MAKTAKSEYFYAIAYPIGYPAAYAIAYPIASNWHTSWHMPKRCSSFFIFIFNNR